MKCLQRTDRRTDNRQSEKLTSFQLRWANKFTDYGYLWSILLTFNSKFILLSLNLVQRKTRTYFLFGLTHTGIDFNIKIHCKMQSSNILQYIYILLAHHMVIVHPRLVDCIPLSSLMASQLLWTESNKPAAIVFSIFWILFWLYLLPLVFVF